MVQTLNDVPTLESLGSDLEYRFFAYRAPANDCYAEKLVINAMPCLTDANPRVVGHLVVGIFPPGFALPGMIEWIEVDKEHRRKGVARRMLELATRLAGRKVFGEGVTSSGMGFCSKMGIELEEVAEWKSSSSASAATSP